ncbi:hypothetical protein F2P79_004218 [Pimephales promelas]|nr:hypothetical protein F2P79_004218 [Pimephales promelas]
MLMGKHVTVGTTSGGIWSIEGRLDALKLRVPVRLGAIILLAIKNTENEKNNLKLVVPDITHRLHLPLDISTSTLCDHAHSLALVEWK